MTKVELVIESVEENVFWGRVEYDDDLIVESAATIEQLEKKFRKLLQEFHGLDPKQITFELQYDITALFDEKKYLNASAVAEMAGINKSLMRQYVSGVKNPSYERALHIQNTIHQIGYQLTGIKISSAAGGSAVTKSGTEVKTDQSNTYKRISKSIENTQSLLKELADKQSKTKVKDPS